MHRVIYDELCLGVVREESRAAYRAVIDRLVADGAEGIVLGCTEIELLVRPKDSPVPLFATTQLHVAAAVERALNDCGPEPGRSAQARSRLSHPQTLVATKSTSPMTASQRTGANFRRRTARTAHTDGYALLSERHVLLRGRPRARSTRRTPLDMEDPACASYERSWTTQLPQPPSRRRPSRARRSGA